MHSINKIIFGINLQITIGRKIKIMAKIYVSDEDMENVGKVISHCVPRTKEEYFYRKIFDTFYKNAEDFIPEFWMPKWSPETIDPSARTLAIYESASPQTSSHSDK